MKKRFLLFLAWLHEYFHHPLENVRQANPVKPRKLYHNFGNICMAVPHTHAETTYLAKWPDRALSRTLLLQAIHSPNPLVEMDNMYSLPQDPNVDAPSYCNFCDFYRCGLPCPAFNRLADGSPVCETHKYIIIKHAQKA